MNNSKKPSTVKENRLFLRAYSKGTCAVSKSVAVYVLKNRRSRELRYGITVSKDRGGAVVRNRLRRVISAAYRELYPRLKRGYIVIIVARQGCVGKKSSDVKTELEKLFSKIGLFYGSHPKLEKTQKTKNGNNNAFYSASRTANTKTDILSQNVKSKDGDRA